MLDLPFPRDARRIPPPPRRGEGRVTRGGRALLLSALLAMPAATAAAQSWRLRGDAYAQRGAFRGGRLLAAALRPMPAATAAAQSWRLRVDAYAQRVAFRGVTPDSVAESAVQAGPTGGPVSPDGFAVSCAGDGFCRFYRPGPMRRGVPASAGVDLTLWGLGVPGLSVRIGARTVTDLSGDRDWPGTSPAFRLLEGYAEYIRGGLTARAGRMLEQSRLGAAGTGGLDGVRATWRLDPSGVELGAYAGWGLARGTILAVTSPAVNPLADFQPA